MNTSDIVFDTLERWGVDVVFGLPGDGINGLVEALRKREDRIRFVLVRHEEAAALAACGYAKFTGRLGVCLATTGPGGLHLLNGLHDAKMDGAPVLAITGTTYTDLKGSQYQQDVDLARVFESVAEFNETVLSPQHAPLATDLACRMALARRGVAHLSVPIDVQEAAFEPSFTKHRIRGQTPSFPLDAAVRPPRQRVEEAASVLNGAERVVILAGAGARGARAEVVALAERLQAPIVKALLGKDAIPDDHPLCLGGLGLLGTAPSEKAMEETDCLLMIGTNFPYSEFLPDGKRKVQAIQIDVRPSHIGLRYPVDVGLVGDARAALEELLPLVDAKGASDWLEGLKGDMRSWWGLMEDRGTRQDTPLKPQVLAWELGKRLRDDAIVCGDSGTNTTWVARHVPMRGEMRFSCSGMLASMASALPYAVAAQTAYPDRQVVAFQGDGGFLMLLGELGTIVQHELPVKIFVVNNNTLGQIKWEQMVFLGNPSYGVDFPQFDYAKIAEGFGIRSWRLDRPQDAPGVVEAALAHDGPALVQAVVDPFEPPMPASVKLEQAVHMAKALARGEPNRARIGLTIFRDKLDDLFRPRRAREDETPVRRP